MTKLNDKETKEDKILKAVIKFILSFFAIVILTLGGYFLIVTIQYNIFVPSNYLMWIFNYPLSILFYIYQAYIIFIFIYVGNEGLRKTFKTIVTSFKNFHIKKRKRVVLYIFVIVNAILLYAIIINVSVVNNKKIINYSFFCPQGKAYSYSDVVKINTGVYGKKFYFPFTHSKGDFFYIIELADGTKIDLTAVGGVKNDVQEDFIIDDLDKKFVKMNIPKVSSMANFEYTTDNLNEIYTDKIKEILENTESNK